MRKRILVVLLCIMLTTISFGSEQSSNDKAGWSINSDTWALYDALGREMPEKTKIPKEDKYVLMFYHIWHADFLRPTLSSDSKAPRNVTKIITENSDALSNSKLWGPNISYHYWGEPLFGYYDLSKDDYVIRKHAQMLSDAGVDSLVIDYSNYMGGGGFSYTKAALTNLLNVFNTIRNEGGDTPYVTLLCTWDAIGSEKAATDFYNDFYTNKDYEKLWFRWEGKPLILAHSGNFSEELNEFFTTRRPFPLYTPVDSENAWPWLSLYPQQPGYTKDNDCEIMSVGVAQNWTSALDFMSAQDEDGNFIARGRSYTSKNQKLLKDPTSAEYESEKGLNFQECFDYAIKKDPSAIFITGWNEWIAARFLEIPGWANMSKNPVPPFGGFCDVFSTEFSRDIEPTREGNLKDNFYNQLAINIRRFKGSENKVSTGQEKTIKIDGSFEDWKSIKHEYRDDLSDVSLRNAQGIGKDNMYVNTTGRNDFKSSKVSYDKENIYFYVSTVSQITPYSDSMWMNLFIRVKGTKAYDKSWEGFQYVLNRSNVASDFTRVERSLGGWNWEVAYDFVQYKVVGSEMEIAIPLSVLNLDYNKGIDIEFKWFDNMQNEGDALEFYLNGDAAPNERFSYSFKSAEVNSSGSLAGILKPSYIIPVMGAFAVIAAVYTVILIKRKRGKT